MENVLVTGGAGFIGSHLVDALVTDYNVVVLDNLSTGFRRNLPHGTKIIPRDIREPYVFRLTEKVSYVFHLAAEVSVKNSMLNPLETLRTNSMASANLLGAALPNQVKKIILASSAAVYGDNVNLPLRETELPFPESPYGTSKLAMEFFAQMYSQLGSKTACPRFFNVYGPRQNPRSQYSAVIPKFILNALKGEELSIRGDGMQTRDFVFVEDVVSAYELLMKKGEGIFNIASGEKTSILDLAERIIRLTNSKSKIVYEKKIEGDILHSVADISKAQKELGFQPRYSLEEGLRRTISFFRKSY